MIPPEPDPPEPGPDPPTPTPTYNDWEYLRTSEFYGYTVYEDVGSASDAFVGDISVGLSGNVSWYNDGSLIKIGTKYYPFKRDDMQYYDYDNRKLMYFDTDDGSWAVQVTNPTVFDQVPANVIEYLQTGNFTLVQG